MIPRLKPYYRTEELKALFALKGSGVAEFEEHFARAFHAGHALTFNYGRSALYAILKSQGIRNAEIILPAYTCVVVADAVVLSGNIPRFVDITADGYNMDLDLLAEAVNERTGAIVATSLFGYPIDTDRVQEIVRDAGRGILLIQDCAQSFGVTHRGSPVCNQGDAAIFSLRMNKIISTILGAIATTNRKDVFEKLKAYRDRHYRMPGLFSRMRRLFYVLSTYLVFSRTAYRFVNTLEIRGLIDAFTKSYSETKIRFPSDAMELLTTSAAGLGMVQLGKYEDMIEQRRGIAAFYHKRLAHVRGLRLPPMMEEATWSYYCPRVRNKGEVMRRMRSVGVQVGEVLEYAVPYMPLYNKYRDREFPNALACSRTTINLPVHPGLTEGDLNHITGHLERILS
ncbi:MAG: DegT/DnrJ/EryC1/StrS family aminotransferase [Deltaproteobacteria bacterium]|nr:DegT/DnrJ/EryC1/StrS family aminotransferase [Deltaproteobacteria bacterium]